MRLRKKRTASAEGIMGAVFGAVALYPMAEFALSGQPHPAHWMLAAFGAGAGFVSGELFHRQREPF